MRLIKIPMLAGLLLALAACSVSTRSVEPPKPPVLVQPDSALTKDCARPVDLGTSPLSQEQTETLWSEDRQALINCGRGKRSLHRFYTERDARLMNLPIPTPRPAQ